MHARSMDQRPARSDDGGKTVRSVAGPNHESLSSISGLLNAAGPVQRVRYSIGRNSAEPHSDKKLAAAQRQNLALKQVREVHVEAGATASSATLAADASHTERAQLDAKQLYPADKILEDRHESKFNGQYYNYWVNLISHPEAEPADWSTANSGAIDEAVAARVAAPYAVTSVTKKGGSASSMGRALGGAQGWGLNPEFGKSPTIGSRTFTAWAQVKLWALQELELPAEAFVKRASVPEGLIALPAPASEPIIFYIHRDTPRIDQPRIERLSVTPGEFEAKYSESASSGDGHARQTGISAAPFDNRKVAHRDPNKEMGVSASTLVDGGFAPPMKGALASHEWCHLIGDADGGKCAPENLVLGTNSVNTEQLAMENSLRAFRSDLHSKFGLEIEIDARAVGETVVHEGKTYVVAKWIRYTLNLLNPANGSKLFVHSREMHGQRGVISDLEYKYVAALIRAEFAINLDMMMRHPEVLAALGVTMKPPELPDITEEEMLAADEQVEDESTGSRNGFDDEHAFMTD